MGRQFDNMEKTPKENKTKNVRDSLLVLSLICLLLTTIVFGLEVNSFHKLKRELLENISATTQVHIDWFEITTHPEKVQGESTSMDAATNEAENISTTHKTQGRTTPSQKTHQGNQEANAAQAPITPNSSANVRTQDVIPPNTEATYVVNTKSKKIHKSDCRYVQQMKPENRKTVDAKDLQTLVNDGYSYCSACCKSE